MKRKALSILLITSMLLWVTPAAGVFGLEMNNANCSKSNASNAGRESDAPEAVEGQVVVLYEDGAVDTQAPETRAEKNSVRKARKARSFGTAMGEASRGGGDETEMAENTLGQQSDILTESLGSNYVIEDTVVLDSSLDGQKDADETVVSTISSDKYTSEQLIEKLSENENIAAAEPNYIFHTLGMPDWNDTYINEAWQNTDKGINADKIWDDPALADGESPVVIAVMDTGIDYEHEDLAGRMWTAPKDFKLKGEHGMDFVEKDDTPMDENGHGSHCAGIIAAAANNGIGTAGAAGTTDKVQLMAVRILDESGSGTFEDIISAFYYLARAKNEGVDIRAVNCSFGATATSEIFDKVIDKVGASGILTIAAAGNETADNDQVSSAPANCKSEYVISVAALDDNGELASYSNYGTKSVDVAAPGSNILSTVSYNNYAPYLYDNETISKTTEYYGEFGGAEITEETDDNGKTVQKVTPVSGTDYKGEPVTGADTFGESVMIADRVKGSEGKATLELVSGDGDSFPIGNNKTTLRWKISGAKSGDTYVLYFPYEKMASTYGDTYANMVLRTHTEADGGYGSLQFGDVISYVDKNGKLTYRTIATDSFFGFELPVSEDWNSIWQASGDPTLLFPRSEIKTLSADNAGENTEAASSKESDENAEAAGGLDASENADTSEAGRTDAYGTDDNATDTYNTKSAVASDKTEAARTSAAAGNSDIEEATGNTGALDNTGNSDDSDIADNTDITADAVNSESEKASGNTANSGDAANADRANNAEYSDDTDAGNSGNIEDAEAASSAGNSESADTAGSDDNAASGSVSAKDVTPAGNASESSAEAADGYGLGMVYSAMTDGDVYIDLSSLAISKAGADEEDFGKYDVYSGTSMATPVVTGSAGLIAAMQPELSAAELRDKIFETTRDGYSEYCSTGGAIDFSAYSKETETAKPVISEAVCDFGKNAVTLKTRNAGKAPKVTADFNLAKRTEEISQGDIAVNGDTLTISDKYGLIGSDVTFIIENPENGLTGQRTFYLVKGLKEYTELFSMKAEVEEEEYDDWAKGGSTDKLITASNDDLDDFDDEDEDAPSAFPIGLKYIKGANKLILYGEDSIYKLVKDDKGNYDVEVIGDTITETVDKYAAKQAKKVSLWAPDEQKEDDKNKDQTPARYYTAEVIAEPAVIGEIVYSLVRVDLVDREAILLMGLDTANNGKWTVYYDSLSDFGSAPEDLAVGEVYDATFGAYNGKLYYFDSYDCDEEGNPTSNTRVYCCTPSAKGSKWEASVDMTVPVSGGRAIGQGGNLYYFFGKKYDGSIDYNVYKFNGSEWTEAGKLPPAVYTTGGDLELLMWAGIAEEDLACAYGIDEKGIVFAGRSFDEAGDTFRFNTSTGKIDKLGYSLWGDVADRTTDGTVFGGKLLVQYTITGDNDEEKVVAKTIPIKTGYVTVTAKKTGKGTGTITGTGSFPKGEKSQLVITPAKGSYVYQIKTTGLSPNLNKKYGKATTASKAALKSNFNGAANATIDVHFGKISTKLTVKKVKTVKVGKVKLKAYTDGTINGVKWKSSNKKYAKVNKNGTITFKKAGIGKTVKLTAISKENPKLKKTIKVKIKGKKAKTKSKGKKKKK